MRWFAVKPMWLGQASPALEQGLKPYGTFHGSDLDQVSRSNGNLFIRADLLAYSQRGGELAYPIVLEYSNENYSINVTQPNCGRLSSVGGFGTIYNLLAHSTVSNWFARMIEY